MSKVKKFWMFVGGVNGALLGLVAFTVLMNTSVQMTPTAAWIFFAAGITGLFGNMLSLSD